MRGIEVASEWLRLYNDRFCFAGQLLDLACGSGRNARFLLELGFHVTAVDRDLSGVTDLRSNHRANLIEADLESEPWPLEGMRFDGVVVVNYLHRPNLPRLIECLRRQGVLIYDTFAAGNEKYGRPRNPDYLLRPGELLAAFGKQLSVVAYSQGRVDGPRPSVRQRICARRD